MGLEGLDKVEVSSFTLREAVLSVELKLGNNDRVLSPAMHVKGSLGEHKGSGVRDGGVGVVVRSSSSVFSHAGKTKRSKDGS